MAFAGVLSIGLAIVCSFGICMFSGLMFTSMTAILPFVLVGIGVVKCAW